MTLSRVICHLSVVNPLKSCPLAMLRSKTVGEHLIWLVSHPQISWLSIFVCYGVSCLQSSLLERCQRSQTCPWPLRRNLMTESLVHWYIWLGWFSLIAGYTKPRRSKEFKRENVVSHKTVWIEFGAWSQRLLFLKVSQLSAHMPCNNHR